MAKRIVPSESKKRLPFLIFTCIAAISYFFVTIFSLMFNIKNLNNEEEKLNNQLISLQEEEENKVKEIDKLKNDEYKAKYAREYFLYSKPEGEYIFSIDSIDENKELPEQSEHLYVPTIVSIVVCCLFVFLIFVFLIRKKEEKIEG